MRDLKSAPAAPEAISEFLTLNEAAELVRRRHRTIRAWVDDGRLKSYGEPGQRVLVRRQEVLAAAVRPRGKAVTSATSGDEVDRLWKEKGR